METVRQWFKGKVRKIGQLKRISCLIYSYVSIESCYREEYDELVCCFLVAFCFILVDLQQKLQVM